jgi:hypothetical protein
VGDIFQQLNHSPLQQGRGVITVKFTYIFTVKT